VLGQNTFRVNFIAMGTKVSPNLYQIYHKNEEGALEANQAQFYISYCLTVNKNIFFPFDKIDQYNFDFQTAS
jgi:hypothetical protein